MSLLTILFLFVLFLGFFFSISFLFCLWQSIDAVVFSKHLSVVGYNNMEELVNAMKNKEVAGALVDMYAAATKKEIFQGGDIQLNRVIEYPTGYGVVLSGNMAEAAPFFLEALSTQKGEISRIIEENTETISQVFISRLAWVITHLKIYDVNISDFFI